MGRASQRSSVAQSYSHNTLPFSGGHTSPQRSVEGYDEKARYCKAGQLCKIFKNAHIFSCRQGSFQMYPQGAGEAFPLHWKHRSPRQCVSTRKSKVKQAKGISRAHKNNTQEVARLAGRKSNRSVHEGALRRNGNWPVHHTLPYQLCPQNPHCRL